MRGEGGYSLVEVLVAFAILAVSLGTLFAAFGTSTRLAQASEQRTIALLHAQSVLDQMSLEHVEEATTTSGDLEGIYRWEAQIQPHGSAEDRAGWIAVPYEIAVSVFWGERGVTLETIRLLPEVP